MRISTTTARSTGCFDAASEPNPLLHTWSLAVEEQFYLLFAIALFVAWKLGKTAPQAESLTVLIGAGLVSFTVSVFLVDAPDQRSILEAPQQFSFFASPTRAWGFVAGALLAFIPDPIRRLRSIVSQSQATAEIR